MLENEKRESKNGNNKKQTIMAQVYKYDTTKEICDGDYFFMENLDGVSWISAIDHLGDDVNASLRVEVGKLQKKEML